MSGDPPAWNYPEALPVVGRREEIVAAVRAHRVVVVVGETGSGKTTQLPKMVAEALGERMRGRVGCTQPRRLAAVSVAARVAQELRCQPGGYVGYQVRFDEKLSRATRIKFMTDGILLAETQADRDLRRYSALIIDEAHERSLNIDFLLGYLRRLLDRRRDLKVVISSATMDAGAFVEFFSGIEGGGEGSTGCALIEVAGRTFPVEEEYLPPEEDEELAAHVARAVGRIAARDAEGDVLVFLPGEREIRECAEVLAGRDLARTEVLPLFARMGLAEQQRIFQVPKSGRRVVLATNVAETSLTIPGIVYVVDSGLARVSRWSPARGVQRLHIEEVSQASARQRKGRCGRVRPGVCVRLHGAEELLDRPEYTDPEIRRSSLAGVILRMKSLGLPEIEHFPFLDPPTPKLVTEGYRTLREIGALDKEKRLTETGRLLARMPLDPRLGRMLLQASTEDCLAEVLVIVAGLEASDPRERPAERAGEADAAQARWRDAESDFRGLLRLWMDLREFRDGGRWRMNRLRKWCKEHFLNWRRAIEWGNLRDELEQTVRDECGWRVRRLAARIEETAAYDKVHRSLLAGVPRQFAWYDAGKKEYRSGSGQSFAVFPGSGLFGGKRHEWVLAFELVETSRLWARRVARMDPVWVEEVAPHLCRSRYGEAAWDVKQGAVYAKETVVCGGLPVVSGRRVHLGRIDVAAAREVFLRDGLLGGGLTAKCPFLERLDEVRAELAEAEERLRRQGGLWGEEDVFAFFDERVPRDICTAAAFHRWRTAGNEDKLMIRVEDLVPGGLEELGLDGFPDQVEHGGETYPLYYRNAPGERDDGLTVGVHIDQLPVLPAWLPEWGVPGMLEERVERLIRKLPKDLRRACQPVSETARAFAVEWWGKSPDGPLARALAAFLKTRTGLLPPVDLLDPGSLEGEALVKVWVCDDDGEELGFGSDVEVLRHGLTRTVRGRVESAANALWERSGMKVWDGEALPERLAGAGGEVYPALVDEANGVGVRVFSDAAEARESHRAGCVRLLMMTHGDQASHLAKRFPLGMAARIELPRLGRGGVSASDLVAVAGEGALGVPLPRDPAEFGRRLGLARARWHDSAVEVAKALDEAVEVLGGVRAWIAARRKDRHLGEVAADLEEELEWLLRPRFVWRAGHARMRGYGRYWRAIRSRLGRLESLPLVRDLEKMERVRKLWVPWLERWTAEPEKPKWWDFGWKLEDLRAGLFAPDLGGSGVSEKKLADEWDALAKG